MKKEFKQEFKIQHSGEIIEVDMYDVIDFLKSSYEVDQFSGIHVSKLIENGKDFNLSLDPKDNSRFNLTFYFYDGYTYNKHQSWFIPAASFLKWVKREKNLSKILS